MRRTRLLFAAAALVLLGFVGFARPAAAQESAPKLNEPVEKCIKQLEDANSIDVDCQKAPNPLVPEKNEIIWGVVGFGVVFIFLAKFGLPGIKSGMNARTERIQGDLDAAEAQRTEASAILADYQAKLAEARTESGRIIEEARKAADEVRTDLMAKAEADAAEARAKGLADAAATKAQIMDDLRGEVTSLAISAAEQVVGRSLDRDTNVALVESFIDSVGAKS